ncbi:hypothetical protein [Pseudoxanthomonas wuyuanensis]
MNAAMPLRDALNAARRQRLLITAAFVVPWAVALAAVAWRGAGAAAALSIALPTSAAFAAWGGWQWRKRGHAWAVRELNARRTDMQDSADLLLAGAAALNPLQQLQRQRLQQRLGTAPPDLRSTWPLPRLAASTLSAIIVLAAALAWPAARPPSPTAAPGPASAAAAATAPIRMTAQQLRIVPPAYTRLPAREEASLQARAPQGSQLQWRLRFSPQPAAVALVFHNGKRLPLSQRDGDWVGSQRLDASTLYRVEAAGAPSAPAAPLHRLDAIADRPPQLKVIAPDRSLSLMTLGQRSWEVVFEGSDDYGIAANAQLRITLAQGTGENITFRETTVGLPGRGDATRKRYTHRLDLAALGLAAGDDLVVQLSVNDNRAPQPQHARSPSLILRWPSDLGSQSSGLEGMVKKTLPAYFRSQRQIIIDAEALLKEKPRLASDRFIERSDGIGVDQRILRLRYGQFLGEEAEGDPEPPPTNDAEDAHDDGDDDHGRDSAAAGAGHDHGTPPAEGAGFGREADVLAEYGHTHDHAEAATLLDPETRATLKQALDQMWQSELHLRQGHPDRALPYAYKALQFIKQVQQASRIYLARVGPELPPVDESRRLSGDRAGLARRADALAAATAADPTIGSLWRALEIEPATGEAEAAADLDALERWLREHPAQAGDPLSLIAAIDALRRQPRCDQCREQLRTLLWPLLTRPPANVPRRNGGDAAGQRYLDALGRESGE